MITDRLRAHLGALEAEGLYRRPMLINEDNKLGLLNFSSNDYLSLRKDKRIQAAFQRGHEKYPSGSGASPLISGYHGVHQELEAVFAKALGVERALLFNSGFAANVSVMTLFASLEAHLLVDKAVHASIYDGLRLGKAKYARFIHNDLSQVQQKIIEYPQNQIVITEGIFSMSGQKAELKALAKLAQTHHSLLFVDEAHSFGVLGPKGLGAVAEHQLGTDIVPLRMLSFGKAAAAQGAIVAGQADWIEGLIQVGRPYIYSTGMSPAFAYGLLETLPYVLAADDRREKLFQLVDYFRKSAQNSPLNWRHSTTPIQQLQLGCPHLALSMASHLQEVGIHCLPIRPPTLSLKETGLRVVLNYHHERADIDKLFQTLQGYFLQ